MTRPFKFENPEINPGIYHFEVAEVQPDEVFSAFRTLRAMREARLEQLDGIVPNHVLPQPEAVTQHDVQGELRAGRADPNRRVYHATISTRDASSLVPRNTLVGVGVFNFGADILDISNIYVPEATDDAHISMHRRGIASTLLATGLHEATNPRAITRITLPRAHASTGVAERELAKWGFDTRSGRERMTQAADGVDYPLEVVDFEGLPVSVLRQKLVTRHRFLEIVPQPVFC
jgi:hypothetical protein